MRMKKLLSIVFATLLLMSMAVVVTATPWDGVPDDPTPAQSIWVDPKNTTGLSLGAEFVVDILVNITSPTAPGGGTGMYGFQYKFKWNSTVLQVLEIQTHSDGVPSGDLLPGWTSVYVAANETGVWPDGRDYHSYAVSATGGVAFTGVDSLCTYKFKVQYQPAYPEADYLGLLDIQEEILVDDTATPIDHVTVDGAYHIPSVVPEKPKVGLDPDYVMGVYAENFTVDIVIEDSWPLFPQYDLVGWEAKLYYNTTVLDALEGIEGAWFASFAGPNGTYPIVNINETAGVVHVADLYLGNHTKPSGAGVLMTIKFNATSYYEVPPGVPPHLYPLDLEDVLLVDSASQPIPQKFPPNDGVYEEPYEILGWSLDCWTDPLRKLNATNTYQTPNTGEGINKTADAYEPQEFVKLYAKLMYNKWPEANKIIMFEIYGPKNPYHNVSIIRTAVTNASGIATINFTIPHPDANLEEIVFGKWVCLQKAQVKDPWDPNRYGVVTDWIWWDVGWKVELLSAEVEEPGDNYPGGFVNVTIWYKNIAQVALHGVFTLTVFDTLLDPIGELVVPFVVEAGAYCNPTYDYVTNLIIPIPIWVHVGPSAHVNINAFTRLPMQSGLPYCPEVEVHFTISTPP